MFNLAETENEKDNPGVTARTIGIVVAVLSALLVFVQMSGGSFSPIPWLGFVLAFALIVIGYMQKIAANK